MAADWSPNPPGALGGDLAIGKAAALAGVSTRTLRYYEQLGLLTPSARTPGGARRYSAGDVTRLLRIRELQSLMGFNLTDIQSIVAAEDRLQSLCQEFRTEILSERKRDIAVEAIGVTDNLRAQVAEKLDKVRVFLAALDERVARYQGYLSEGPGDGTRVSEQPKPVQTPEPKPAMKGADDAIVCASRLGDRGQ